MPRHKDGCRTITIYLSVKSFVALEAILSRKGRSKRLARSKDAWCSQRLESILRSIENRRGGK